MIKHIIFDFDGTLVDSKDLSVDILNHFSDKYGYRKVTSEEVQVLKHLPVRKRFKAVGLRLRTIPKMTVDVMTMYLHQTHNLKAFDGIHDLVYALKANGYCLSVISSNAAQNINSFLKRNDMEVFDHVISSHNLFGKHKIIKRYIKHYGLKKEELIYVGDELRDIISCKKVPLEIIAVVWGFDPIELLQTAKPEYVVNTPNEILGIVQSI